MTLGRFPIFRYVGAVANEAKSIQVFFIGIVKVIVVRKFMMHITGHKSGT